MKTKDIAEALCLKLFDSCARAIVPPWAECDDGEKAAHDAWRQVQVLRRQRDELAELWPHKKAALAEQFNDAVMKLAREVHDAFYDLTA